MGAYLYGTELPTFPPGGAGGAAVNRYDLAHAKEEIEAPDTHTVVAGEQYIVAGGLAVTGTLVLGGTLVVL
jgi:hypothetical protein